MTVDNPYSAGTTWSPPFSEYRPSRHPLYQGQQHNEPHVPLSHRSIDATRIDEEIIAGLRQSSQQWLDTHPQTFLKNTRGERSKELPTIGTNTRTVLNALYVANGWVKGEQVRKALWSSTGARSPECIGRALGWLARAGMVDKRPSDKKRILEYRVAKRTAAMIRKERA